MCDEEGEKSGHMISVHAVYEKGREEASHISRCLPATMW